MRKFQKNICFSGWVIAGSKHALTILFTSFILLSCSDGQDTSSTESGTSGINQSLKSHTVIDDNALSNESDTENWLAFGRTYSEQRHSPLKQINTKTVSGLKPDWYLDLPHDAGLTATPLVADGILYFSGSMSRVRAVNAVTGALIWEYDPEVVKNTGNNLRAGWSHNRGISLWNDKVYVATWDGRLVAIDRASGTEVWSVRTFEKTEPLYITGAPKIFKGKVLIGNGGTEHGPNQGYVTAYDAETGAEKDVD